MSDEYTLAEHVNRYQACRNFHGVGAAPKLSRELLSELVDTPPPPPDSIRRYQWEVAQAWQREGCPEIEAVGETRDASEGTKAVSSKVFVHTRSAGGRDWHNEPREFLRLPHVGEYIALASRDFIWHRVEMVVHCPFDTEYAAEVYCVRVHQDEVMKRECPEQR